MKLHYGFTLIELLVVITIIVVLLAMLAPALDKAIYEAELTVCGAKLRGLGGGLVTYAMGYQRRYPQRTGLVGGGRRCIELRITWWPDGPLGGANGDDRPFLQPLIPINVTLNCPLTKAVDLETTDPASQIYSPYARWYSWRFGQQKGMFKLGDRFEYGGERFRVLASDCESVSGMDSIQAAHPDKDGILTSVAQQNAPAGFLDRTWTFSRWEVAAAGNLKRGTMDRNFLYEDLSVSRYNDLILDDPRLGIVPWHDADTPADRGLGVRETLPIN